MVNGYLEVLGERHAADEQSARWIGAGRRAVGRMSGLITSLLSYAQAGHAPAGSSRPASATWSSWPCPTWPRGSTAPSSRSRVTCPSSTATPP
ncbi:hypothetical protein [Paractinoplanes durhamensis]|uniref:hypothetical protein n=1 Tax=Paractinoplanes durhamensis TaxID=113563 RepID=UPI00362DC79D